MTTTTEFADIRFFAGGVVVSAFSVLGESVEAAVVRGSFFGASAVGRARRDRDRVLPARREVRRDDEAKAMVGGAIAMLVYASLCARVTRVRGVPVWLEAGLAWLSWFGTAGTIYASLRLGGIA